MFDTRKKATMPQALADIKPYLTKRFLSAPVIDDKNLPVICQTLLCRYWVENKAEAPIAPANVRVS